MKNRLSKTPFPFICAMSALLSGPSFAQDRTTSTAAAPLAPWTVSATLGEESIGQGLPVLALDRPDWPRYRSDHEATPRAWRSLQAELLATHPSGWRLGVLARAEAWLQASPDAVTAAALDATDLEPETGRRYQLDAQSQSWQGRGIKVGTPWLALDTAKRWHWQADAQLMRLQRLRTVDLSGSLLYRGGDVYDFNIQSLRSNPGITGPFLGASGSAGLGTSLSVALQGEPAPGWQLQLRADDLLSRLVWPDLATDAATLDSEVTSRAPDGSLDYAPLVKGQKSLQRVTGRIGTRWQAQASWSAFASSGQPGALTLRADRKAGLNQYWLGWDNSETARNRPHWRLEIEPLRRVASVGLAWRGWHALLATDGKGTGSEFRAVKVGWRAEF